ncbi:MAG TPA: hypothetical protein VNH44_15870 [Micropepsaceae bacterium]|nr:hypothetical protein [Micropepsaceae bacterium]
MNDKKGTSGESGVQGEGDYKSARVYKQDIEGFIRKKGSEIPKMAQDAEKAVEGPEGAELAKAEEKGKAKARH